MHLKISLLKCIFLLNLTTIQCFNVIMMKNLTESQLVNKLTEISNDGENENRVHGNVNSIYVRSQGKQRNPSVTSSEEDDKEDTGMNNNDKMEVESDKSDVIVPISNITMKKRSKNKHKDAINPENSSETVNKKATKRTKKHKKTIQWTEKSNEIKRPNIGSTITTLWNTLRTWFRRNGVSGLRNKNIKSFIDDQNLIDVMKRIIIIMRSSEKSGKIQTNNYEPLNSYVLRNERSGEDNDPLAPGKLPMNLLNLFTSTEPPKPMWYKPNSFWNYWTYPKEVFTDNCKGEGLVQYGNLCIDTLGH